MTLAQLPAARPLRGAVNVPGDKSIAHRALILGALAEGTLRLSNFPEGKDVLSTCLCLRLLGADLRRDGGKMEIRGTGLHGFRAPNSQLPCGNSGTTMRLLMGLLAGQPFETVLTGDASLSARPMRRVADPLSRMGARIKLTDAQRPPVRVRGRRPLSAFSYRLPVPSSQVKSALLLAGLWADGETCVIDPFGTRDHTERILEYLSPGCLQRKGSRIRLKAARLRSDKALALPGDASSAAALAAAAAIIPGSDITLRGVLLNGTRLGFFRALRRMGARIELLPLAVQGAEPVGDIRVRYAPLRAVRVEARMIASLIDEVPLLAVLAASAAGQTRIHGLRELRLKESDRLSGTVAGLRALGADAAIEEDSLIVRGPTKLIGGRVNCLGDHRLAMAFSVAALAASRATELCDPACVSMSFPGFYDLLSRLSQ